MVNIAALRMMITVAMMTIMRVVLIDFDNGDANVYNNDHNSDNANSHGGNLTASDFKGAVTKIRFNTFSLLMKRFTETEMFLLFYFVDITSTLASTLSLAAF